VKRAKELVREMKRLSLELSKGILEESFQSYDEIQFYLLKMNKLLGELENELEKEGKGEIRVIYSMDFSSSRELERTLNSLLERGFRLIHIGEDGLEDMGYTIVYTLVRESKAYK